MCVCVYMYVCMGYIIAYYVGTDMWYKGVYRLLVCQTSFVLGILTW